MTYNFYLTDEQLITFNKWREEQIEKNEGPSIGGRWTFSFTETGIGVVTKAFDNLLDEEIDLSDYDCW